jgi:hypothetical protein
LQVAEAYLYSYWSTLGTGVNEQPKHSGGSSTDWPLNTGQSTSDRICRPFISRADIAEFNWKNLNLVAGSTGEIRIIIWALEFAQSIEGWHW